ncbi:MAG: hypothetical protein ACLUFH_02065 [Monoglobales bacterium]
MTENLILSKSEEKLLIEIICDYLIRIWNECDSISPLEPRYSANSDMEHKIRRFINDHNLEIPDEIAMRF